MDDSLRVLGVGGLAAGDHGQSDHFILFEYASLEGADAIMASVVSLENAESVQKVLIFSFVFIEADFSTIRAGFDIARTA